MKLRSLTLSFSALAVLLITLSVAAISIAYLQFNQLRATNTLANELLGESEQLVNVTLDYLLFSESRSARQWRSKYAEIEQSLEQLENQSDNRQQMHILRESYERIGRVFKRLNDTQLADQRDLAAQISLHLFELQNNIRNINFNLGRDIDAAIDRLVLTGILSLIGLTLFILANLGFVIRRILQPIRLQEREIARVTDTNLSYQLTLTHQDEISSLSDSLKLMIQKRREAETDLQAANETLQAANKELESFAYIASHDLKAPLRGIKSLVSLLTRELGEDLSPDAKRYVDLMANRTERMQALLEGLLQYSRIGRTLSEDEEIDTSKLVDEIRTLIDAGGQWTIINGDNLPRLTTQRAPFELVLRNLIDNAIKHHDRESGTIRIDARTVAERYEFTVSDDGPGIAPEYQERIFQIFHTLKPRDEVEGSGLGLALVQKTVEHFGGSIRVESDPERERGAKFIFTWPKA